ncbi:MAG: helix-turn-helix transcriptional regulator [Clostridiales bacterium]|nr:helix-turn-helix transcriptional regulator [Clostridiales bacterium]
MKIGDKIKELRLESDYTQAELAQKIGVTQKAVDYWERNVNEPKACYLIALVKCFDVSYDEFFCDVDS